MASMTLPVIVKQGTLAKDVNIRLTIVLQNLARTEPLALTKSKDLFANVGQDLLDYNVKQP